MQDKRYALAGFVAVLIVGSLLAYCNMDSQKASRLQQAPAPKSATTDSPKKTSVEAAPAKPQETAPQASAETQKQPDMKPVAKTGNAPAEQQVAAPETEITVPAFDVLRLEGNGSLVIAGKAAPNSVVDVISKTRVLGSATAGENGDFAIVLDEALKSGDYQLVLRATAQDKSVATSQQTAILSVPATPDGQVLALVEEPGQASRMITTPQAIPAVGEGDRNPDTLPAQTGAPSTTLPPQAAQGGTVVKDSRHELSIAVEAVEIDGDAVFVAGHARGGSSVKVSANEAMLGSAVISPEGRFLIQTKQPLAVGDYIIRADLLDASGKILATARVPFRREAGESIAAVAADTAKAAIPALTSDAAQSAQAPGETQAQPLEKAEGSVIIRKGDNLWTISKRTYGSGMRYTTIYLANTDQIKNPDLIWPGQVFVMPKEPLSDREVKQQLPR